MGKWEWVNITLDNIKGTITGTCRKLGPDHAERYLARFAKRRLDPGTGTITDGLDCWTALDRAGCDHRSVRTG